MLRKTIEKCGFCWSPLALLLLCASCGGGGSGGGAAAQTAGGGGGSVQSSPSSMSVGDIANASFSGGSASISFSGASGTYELLLQSQATDGATRAVSVSALSAAGKALGLPNPLEDSAIEGQPFSAQVQLDALLRDEERFLLSAPWDGGASKSLGVSKSGGGGGNENINVAWSVDDTDTFRVLSSLTDVTSYNTITATVKCVNSTVAIFIDDEILSTNPTDLPQADIDTLCSQYATSLATVSSLFGTFSDINADGVAVALITPVVNRLTSGGGGIVTGFFYSGDLFARSGSIPASNAREIVYLLSPDSDGIYGTAVSNAFAMSNFLPAVFPHEIQHLISYYQHTIARSGDSEEDWLNEGLSHLAEDLVGYGRENYSRYDLYLASPQSYSLVSSSTGLAQRGASYLFLRYLYERTGKSATFLSNLVQTTNTGTSNVVNAFTSPSSDFDSFGEFLSRWAVALAYTNRGLTSSSDFMYNARTFNSTTGNYEGVCMVCSASDGRSTVLDGPSFGTYSSSTSYNIKGSTTRFLRLSSVPASLNLSASTAAVPAAIVLRTQ
ncbi:MAG: hypothetical protein A2979_07910 [Deltaproteobacteria bacterium RIFCSPLOWO2_01_FULL_45_74]|nr:MAG: hypothetical protein A3D22_09150 [Deltaproteobacteria bacterium RIFCSPHIGHO2_02_FULL_44_53]OGQ28133.1 MAG: hypothetical protein A3D98_07860 [Deltaproteobacteria bacterium RIFCSPHIGHO2_12_FULL_44_21]OGQ31345.1 MAG: hypothetical protein A2979_07910 [Deltaproteobacteria bacterium RIFCSPLOWO2_01_FULL_45_74]